ncbi:hypothetical protein NRZ28_04640 [Aeromonas hydrophila]|uniref:hypothetical protein n=1 Tax=Aeromonas hydrophila TaxID=644 RepID=UPI00227BF4C5|nr:hypothetical protein [Aeromonas hydrophila]WAF91526.1 hypothetical protein NRZ33_04650 [Aeromonas hydrophila]WAG04252.1 hypothetical protein NRZ28_04640 [Aeromonas hydrophila]
MRRDCMTLMTLGLVLGSLLGGCADIKEAGRTVGHTTRNVTREIGHTTRDVTREIGHCTRDTVKKVGDELSK